MSVGRKLRAAAALAAATAAGRVAAQDAASFYKGKTVTFYTPGSPGGGYDTYMREMIPLLILYPAWGLVQQFLVQSMVTSNLSDASGWLGSPYAVTPISASLFGGVHVPSWKLTAATFVMGLVFTPLYLRHENLWPLGLYHGWLGVLFYQWVLERNPLKRMLN